MSFYSITWYDIRSRDVDRGEGRGGGGGVLERRYVIDLMHGRSRMTVDPRIPTIPRRSMSGFYRPGRHCLQPSAKHREVSGESHGG